MRRSLPGLVALGVVAALAPFAWRWLAPGATPEAPVGVPRTEDATAEALAPPASAPEIRAERGEEAPPPPLPDAGTSPAAAAAQALLREVGRLPVELSVVDRATRTPLADVDLCVVGNRGHGGAVAPDAQPDRPSIVRGDSPLTIPVSAAETAIALFLVRAAGHASATVTIDFRAGGAREVRLDAACELDLLLDAPPGEEKFWFELRRLDDVLKSLKNRADLSEEYARRVGRKPSSWGVTRRTAAELLERMRHDVDRNEETIGRLASLGAAAWTHVALREEWTRFDRIAPGDWVATVVTEKRRDAPLAAAVVHLEAGMVERRTLVPKERTAVPSVAVRGTVDLAPEWSRDAATHAPTRLVLDRAIRLIGLPVEASHRTIDRFEPAGSTRFSWSAGDLATGLWIARLPQYGVVKEFEVVEGEQDDVTIEVGAPCEVDLALIDPRTQKSVTVGQLTVWTGEGDAGGEAKRIERDATDDHFRFRAAVGRLHVHVDAFDENFFVTERAFDLAPGRNDLDFALQQIGRARPRLTDGVAVVPWSDDFRFTVKPVTGDGGLAGWVDDGAGVQLVLAPAGRYAIVVDDIPGYEAAGPIEFEVAGGATVDVPIRLTRAK